MFVFQDGFFLNQIYKLYDLDYHRIKANKKTIKNEKIR